jgi:sortase A
LKEKGRKALRIAGFALIAAGLCVVGYYTYHIIAINAGTQNTLLEAEQLLGDMNAYTGAPQASLSPDAAQGDSLDTDSADDSVDDWPNDPFIDAQDETMDDKAASGTRDPNATPRPPSTKVIGMLVFNSLGGRKVPVLEGDAKKGLAKGAVHHPRSSPPGGVGNCVIFGHRDTVFRGFGSLKVGDTILLEVPGSDPGTKTVYTYGIISMAVINPDDPRIYKSYAGKVMTLVTCYPFHYVGAAPQRYIVVAQMQ